MSRESSLVKNTLILSLGTVIPKFANFIVLPILTGYLTKIEYGTYDLIAVICSLVLPAVTLQIQTSAFRYLIEYKDDANEKSKVVSNIMMFLLPVSVLAVLVMYFVLGNNSFLIRILICAYFLSEIFYSTCGQISRGLLKSNVYATASVVCSLSNLVFVVLFVYLLKMGLLGAVICLFLANALPVCYMMKAVHISKYIDFSLFDKSVLKEMLSYSWPMVPNAMSMWIMNASDRLVISLFLGIEANAVYAVAKKIPNIVTMAQSTFTMAWQESASLASSDSDSSEYYTAMFDIVFSMMAGIMLIILACMPVLFAVLVRGSYEDAYNQMPLLVLGMFFYSIAAYFGGIYTAQKATKSVGMTTLAAAIVNLVTNVCMIRFIGLYAASISTLISYIFLAAFRMVNIQKYVRVQYNKKKIVLVLIILISISVCSFVKTVPMYVFQFIFATVVSVALNKTVICSILKSLKMKISG